MDAAGTGLSDHEVAERLRASGHRATRQRLAVYRALAALGGHRGADELAEWLRVDGEPLPTASVYNALAALESAGLAAVAHRGPPRALYEVARAAHHHFVCRACGAVLDVQPESGSPRAAHAAPVAGAVVDAVEVTYRGLCPGCAGP